MSRRLPASSKHLSRTARVAIIGATLLWMDGSTRRVDEPPEAVLAGRRDSSDSMTASRRKSPRYLDQREATSWHQAGGRSPQARQRKNSSRRGAAAGPVRHGITQGHLDHGIMTIEPTVRRASRSRCTWAVHRQRRCRCVPNFDFDLALRDHVEHVFGRRFQFCTGGRGVGRQRGPGQVERPLLEKGDANIERRHFAGRGFQSSPSVRAASSNRAMPETSPCRPSRRPPAHPPRR